MALHIKSLVKIFIRDRLPFFCTFDSSFFFFCLLVSFFIIIIRHFLKRGGLHVWICWFPIYRPDFCVVRHANLFLSCSSNSRDSSAIDVYASGPELFLSRRGKLDSLFFYPSHLFVSLFFPFTFHQHPDCVNSFIP